MKNRRPLSPCRSVPYLNGLMQSCGICSSCFADNENLVAMTDGDMPPAFTVECSECGNMGPWALSLEGAVRAWRYSKP
jgi:hypothetical protein